MKNLLKILLVKLIALLGFTSCNIIGGGGAVEYGTPNVDFRAKGVVSNSINEPLAGIKVVVNTEGNYNNDTVVTNSVGQYVTNDINVFDLSQINSLQFLDESGIYEDITVVRAELIVEQSELGSGNWYGGTFEATVNPTMVPKK